jgi:exodeoxyribonuclease VII small subunit
VAKAKRPAASKLSFGEAIEEVETILDRLQEDTVDIDDLAMEVRRAVELIKVCREKLDRTDREVRELVAELAEDEQSAAQAADQATLDEGADGGADLRTPSPEKES